MTARSRAAIAVGGLALSLLAPTSLPVQAADVAASRWHLDETFGTDGIAVTESRRGPLLAGEEIVVQPDGKIVVAAETQGDQVTVVRFLADGTLDRAFGHNGFAIKHGRGAGSPLTVALQPVAGQTKIVVTESFTASRRLRVWRFNSDGTSDTSTDGDPGIEFGKNGRAVVTSPGSRLDSPRIAVAPTGSLYIAVTGGKGDRRSPVVLKLDRDGALDPAFGTAGIATLPGKGGFRDVAVVATPDGDTRLVAGGFRGGGFGTNQHWLLAGLTKNGELDQSFGDGGFLDALPPGAEAYCRNEIYRVHPAADGAVVLDGLSCATGQHLIVTYGAVDASGHLDRSYSDDGWAYPVAPGTAGIAASRTGSELASDGAMRWAGVGSPSVRQPVIFGSVRPDGTADPRFGFPGFLTVTLPYEGSEEPDNRFGDLAIDAEGRVLAVVTIGVDDERDRFALVRITNESP